MCGLYVPEQKELFTPGGGLGGNVELVVADANGKVVDKIQGTKNQHILGQIGSRGTANQQTATHNILPYTVVDTLSDKTLL